MKVGNNILIFFCLTLSCLTHAEDRQLIHQLYEKYKSINHYQATFIQSKNVTTISKPLITKGQLEFVLNVGLIWEVKEPLWVKTLINDKGIFKSTKYKQNQKVKDLQIKLIAEIMTELLTANLDKIEGNFETESVDTNNECCWQVNLTPKKLLMKKALKQIILQGEIQADEIQGVSEIIIIDNAKNETTISLDNIIQTDEVPTDEINSKFK